MKQLFTFERKFVLTPIDGYAVICAECGDVIYHWLSTPQLAKVFLELQQIQETHLCSKITPANALPGKPRIA